MVIKREIRKHDDTVGTGAAAPRASRLGVFWNRKKDFEIACKRGGAFGFNMLCFWMKHDRQNRCVYVSKGLYSFPHETHLDQLMEILQEPYPGVTWNHWSTEPGSSDDNGSQCLSRFRHLLLLKNRGGECLPQAFLA